MVYVSCSLFWKYILSFLSVAVTLESQIKFQIKKNLSGSQINESIKSC